MIGEKYLLVIGIDKYPDNKRYPELFNSKKDVLRFSKILQEKYGFSLICDPILDSNATSDNIKDALINLTYKCAQEDHIIIYYAGHGDQNQTSKKGYWIPYDADDDQKKFIKNSSVYDDLEAIEAKHILLISDSCFSGTFITRTRGVGKTLTHDELDARKSRWVFVSGEETTVSDGRPGEGSPFGICLCEFLEKNTMPSLSAGEVFDDVIRMVSSRCRQEPQASPIQSDNHNGGQLIFRINNFNAITLSSEQPIDFHLPDLDTTRYITRDLTFYDYQLTKGLSFFQPEVGNVFLDEIIKTQKHIVVLGSAGSGKSVELLHSAIKLENAKSGLQPIYKKFNTYTQEDLNDYLFRGYNIDDYSNIVVFLDGLDEVQPQFFQTAIRKIMAFAKENPFTKIVISCRNNFYELPYENFPGTLDGFSVYNLNDISLTEIKRYASEAYELNGDEFIGEIYTCGFLDLVQKPFFLNILLSHFLRHRNFKLGRAKIMEDALLEYYNNDKRHFIGTVPSMSNAMAFKYLEKIAFVLELLGRNFLKEEELVALFPSVKDFEVCRYLPAFNRQLGEEKWMFEHNNLQEYIASRVLSKKSFEEIIQIISIKTYNAVKIKPSWVNTLSFFINICSDEEIVRELLAWIIQNDKEVLIRFDADRLNESQRVMIFRDVFDFYNEKKIWIHSNNFSERDLARFGQSEAAISYMLEVLENSDSDRISMLNGLHVLRYFSFRNYPEYLAKIKKAIIKIFNNEDLSGTDIYSLLGTISDLNISDDETTYYIINRYRLRRNQYIRAGLYKFLIKFEIIDENVDIFLDGLDPNFFSSDLKDRQDVNLMDESLFLNLGLKSLSKSSAIQKAIKETLNPAVKSRMLFSDYDEVIISLIQKSIAAFSEYSDMYIYIKNVLVSGTTSNRENIMNAAIDFFEQTKTKWLALKEIWEDSLIPAYVKSPAISHLIDKNTVLEFVKFYSKNSDAEKNINAFYNIVLWYYSYQNVDMLEYFENITYDFLAIKLNRPIDKNWNQIYRQREQKSFNLLFEKHEMLVEIRKIFSAINKDKISRQDLFEYNKKYNIDIEDRFANSAILIISHFASSENSIDYFTIENWITDGDSYWDFCISYIHADIRNHKDLEISPKQKEAIEKWCLEKGKDKNILWDFINRFEIVLSEEVLLDFVNYINLSYDSDISMSGTIEELEKFVPKVKIKDRVIRNLKFNNIGVLEWTNNAGYALRNNYDITYTYIIDKLEQSKNIEYKYNDLLILWFSKTNGIETLKNFAKKALSNDLKWTAISLLEKTNKESEFINDMMREVINDSCQLENHKITAANYLMKQNDIFGLTFVANVFLETLDPRTDFRTYFQNIAGIKDVNSIPILLSLLKVAQREEFKKDRFNNLEERVLSGLHSVGMQSVDNYVAVKSEIENFIVQNEDIDPDINFLHFSIFKIEEQLKLNYKEVYTIESALKEYNSIS